MSRTLILYVTQPHGLFIDDLLVSAGSLINEMTITLYAARELNELEFFPYTLLHPRSRKSLGEIIRKFVQTESQNSAPPFWHLVAQGIQGCFREFAASAVAFVVGGALCA